MAALFICATISPLLLHNNNKSQQHPHRDKTGTLSASSPSCLILRSRYSLQPLVVRLSRVSSFATTGRKTHHILQLLSPIARQNRRNRAGFHLHFRLIRLKGYYFSTAREGWKALLCIRRGFSRHHPALINRSET